MIEMENEQKLPSSPVSEALSSGEIVIDHRLEWYNVIFLPFQIAWRFIISCSVMCAIFITIYEIQFTTHESDITHTHDVRAYFVSFLMYICTALYSIDIFLYFLHRRWINIQQTRLYPPKSYYLIVLDLFSLAPLKYVFSSFVDEDYYKNSVIWSTVMGLPTLIRFYRITEFFVDITYSLGVNQSLVVVLGHMMQITVIIHVCNLVWYHLGLYSHHSWMEHMTRKNVDTAKDWQMYLMSVTTVLGAFAHNWRGEIRVTNLEERVLMSFIMLGGIILQFGFLVGKLISAYVKNNRRYFSFLNHIEVVNHFLIAWDTSKELKKKTIDFFGQYWDHRSGINFSPFFNQLPLSLQKEINVDIFWESFRHCQLLTEEDLPFKRSLSLHMKSEFLLADDYIYKYGDIKSKMVYVTTGVVQVLSAEDGETPVLSLTSGTCFGGLSLLMPTKCKADIKCATYCEVHVLNMYDFVTTLREYPLKCRDILCILKSRISVAQRGVSAEDTGHQLKWLKQRWRELRDAHGRPTEREVGPQETEVTQHTSAFLDMVVLAEDVEFKSGTVCLKTTLPWILEPESDFITFWEIIMLAIIFINCYIIPYVVSYHRVLPANLFPIALICDCFYWLDNLRQCFTAIKTKEMIITRVFGIIPHRFKQFAFLVDILSSVPTHFPMYMAGVENEHILYLSRINRLFRWYRVIVYFKKWEHSLSADITSVRIIKYVVSFISIVYLFCIASYLAVCFGLCQHDSWYAHEIESRTAKGQYEYVSNEFITTLNYVSSVFVGVGTSKTYPISKVDMILFGIAVLLSYLFTAFCFSEYCSTRILHTKYKTRFQQLLSEVESYMSDASMDKELGRRVISYLCFQWDRNRASSFLVDRNLLEDASDDLKEKVIYKKLSDALRNVSLFKNTSDDFISSLVSRVKVFEIPPNARLVTVCLTPTVLYIIHKGYCHMVSYLPRDVEKNMHMYLGPGTAFPVIEFVHGIPSFITVVTQSHCEMIVLELMDFMDVKSMSPEIQMAVDEQNLQEKTQDLRILSDEELFLFRGGLKLHREFMKFIGGDSLRQRIRRGDPGYEKSYAISKGGMTKKGHKRLEVDATKGMKLKVGLTKEQVQYLQHWKPLRKLKFLRYFFIPSGISPNGSFIHKWELARAVFATASAISTPIIYNALIPYPSAKYFGYALDITSWCDMYVRMHVGYYNENGILVSHPFHTTKYYFKHSFFTDLFSRMPFIVLPLKHLLGVDYSSTDYTFYAYTITRAIQMYRFIGYCNYLLSNPLRRSLFFPVLKLVVSLIVLLNILANIAAVSACRHMFTIRHEYIMTKCKSDSWFNVELYQHMLFPTRLYAVSVYYVLSLFTSSAVGVFLPDNLTATWLVLMVGVFSFFLRNWVFASVASLMAGGSVRVNVFQERVQDFTQFARLEAFSGPAVQEALKQFAHSWLRTMAADLTHVMSTLHPALREDVAVFLHAGTMQHVDVLHDVNPGVLRAITKHMKEVFIREGTAIININDVQDMMYVVKNGKLEVRGSSNVPVCELKRGDLFGNFLKRSMTRHNLAVKAVTHVDLLTISSTDFHRIISCYPGLRTDFETAITLNVEYVKKRDDDFMTFIDIVDACVTDKDPAISESIAASRLSYVIYFSFKHFNKCYKIWRIVTYMMIYPVSVVIVLIHIIHKLNEEWILCTIYAVDVLNVIKIFVTFLTPYEEEKSHLLVYDWNKIATRYATSVVGLWLDVVSWLPLEVLSIPVAQPRRATLYLWLKSNRLLRLLFVIHYYHHLYSKLHVSAVEKWTVVLGTIVTTVFILSTFNVMLACPAGVCSFIIDIDDRNRRSLTKSNWDALSVSLFYVCNMVSSTGYHVAESVTTFQIVFNTFTMFASQFMIAVTIGYIASLFEMTNHSLCSFEYRVETLRIFLRDRDLSASIASQVWTYSRMLWSHAHGEGLPALIHEVPRAMGKDLMDRLYGAYLRELPELATAHEDLLAEMAAQLQRCVYFPGNHIAEQGDVNHCMYFVRRGKVEVLSRGRYHVLRVLRELCEGSAFGVAQGLLPNTPHAHIYRAQTVVHLLILDRRRWSYLLEHFPASKRDIDKRAALLY